MHPTRRAALGLGLLLVTVVADPSLCFSESRIPVGNAKYDDANANVFLDDELTSITITMAPADLQAMLSDPHNETYRNCTVHIVNSKIDETLTDCAIRPRGNTSLDSLKKSFKVKFNEFVPGREFHGLEKINLNGEHNDPSIIRSKLSMDLFRKMGVAAPRAHHVHLIINDGSDVDGVFINVEQIDDEFVDCWFGNNDGNLYQCTYKNARADLRYVAPGLPATYQNLGGGETYAEENNEESPDYTDLADFIDFVNNSDDPTFAAGIVDRLNVDSFLRAMAVDVVIGQWDNYWYGANNYYFYHNSDTDAFEFLPYDYDNSYGVDFFGIDWASRPLANWGAGGYGSVSGNLPPLIARILNIPEYEAQLRRYVREIVGASNEPPVLPSTTYTDTVGDVYAGLGPHYDLTSVKFSNDSTNIYIEIQVNGTVDVGGDTGNGEYLFLFNTRTGGSTSNPWGRSIAATVQHDFFIGSWPDGGGGTLIYERQGGSWQLQGSVSHDLSLKTSGIIRYTVGISQLEIGVNDSFTFDAVATGGSTSDPGFDHLSNPSISTPDDSTPSTPGPYLSYTVQPVAPLPPGDGPFTLAQVEARIDAIKAMIIPYAFQGSYSGGTMDYGYDPTVFDQSYTLPTNYQNASSGWDWGLKPYIQARTQSLALTTPAPPALPIISINEILASNTNVNIDETSTFEDWVELYNTGDTAIDLGGMYLTDNPSDPKKWQLSAGTMIASHGFLLVWCDEDLADGPLHADFKLSNGGEGVGLFHDDAHGNVLIDYVPFPAIGVNVSYGRYADGEEALGFMTTVTPNASNAPHNAPPLFEDTTRTPETPASADIVWITSRVTDDGTLTSVVLTYDAGAGAQNVTMFDDGLHQDGGNGDDIYGAAIPPQAFGATVEYYLTATDDDGAIYHDPAEAPDEIYSYTLAPYVPPQLFINEYVASNAAGIQDPDEPGEFPDWIEIYNAGPTSVDMSGMFMTDNLGNPTKHQISAGVVAPPGGYLLFFADEDPSQGPMHVNIKLGAGGEEIGLFATLANGNVPIDTLTFGPQLTDVSEGRFGDGMSCIRRQATATPGAPNLPLFGDQNNDGLVNGLDVAVFANTLIAVSPPPTAVERADLNCDTAADTDDLPLFVDLLLQ